ncbi:MAG: ABC transporter ATP-binding protein [Acholeplasmatales bacterium]|jgi:spermidine/putrescine transport system ATP-binding protein|nr:ABC transporter ATP-binding protein [Acholeplasmatales bacterium]
MGVLIELKDITKEFNGQVVLRGINLQIEENEFVTLLGPSGCGKTTTLRIIGGFETPSSGEVLLNGKDLTHLPAYKRPTNTVFQRYALFPHLNVFENVAFGLRVKGDKKVDAKQQIKNINTKYDHLIKNASDNETIKLLKKEQKEEISSATNSNSYKRGLIKDLQKGLTALDTKYASDKQNLLKEYDLLDKESPSYSTEYQHLEDLYDLQLSTYNNSYDSEVEKINKIKDTLLTRREKEEALTKKVNKYLNMVGLKGYETRSINKLSGGQMQRVAIARALINEPQVLLLDEPLAALDLKLRQEMQYELKELQRNAGITFIYVTHDQEEALTMSDKIVVMNNGEIQQIGTPESIYNEPVNTFVANFIGESNIIEGIMKDDNLVNFDNKDYVCVDKGFGKNEKVDVVIRPEDIDIVSYDEGLLNGVVDSVAFKGVHYEIDVVTEKRTFTIHTTDYHKIRDKVGIKFNKEDIHVMEKWT